MKNQYKIVFVFALILTLVGCSKDFLDVPPVGKMSTDQFYKTDEDATKAIMATYDILQWMVARDWNSIYLVKTFPSDESNVGGGDSGDQPPYQALGNYTYGATNAPITAVWQSCYYGIYRANMVINNVQPETALRTQIVAEAHFLRAYYYFEIASLFGQGPIILTELTPSEYSQPFSPAADIYAQAVTDLNAAIPDLPLKSEYAPEDVFRASQGAAQALLGKVYLYMKNWSASATAFESVIASNQYQLQEDFSTLFLKQSEFGIESLFEVSYVTYEGYDWGTFQWGGNRAMENNITWQLTGPRGDYFVPGNTGLIGGWGFNYPRESAYLPYVEAGDTTRRPATLLSLADLQAQGGDWTNPESWGWGGYIRVKYGTRMSETNGDNGAVPELNYGTNLRLIRYGDVLLMAAEANFRAGNQGAADNYINQVRARANLAPYTGDFFTALVKERQMELAFEGTRFLDLVRWGMAPQVLGPFGFVAGKNEVFPIPQDEMKNNTNAVQNPGY